MRTQKIFAYTFWYDRRKFSWPKHFWDSIFAENTIPKQTSCFVLLFLFVGPLTPCSVVGIALHATCLGNWRPSLSRFLLFMKHHLSTTHDRGFPLSAFSKGTPSKLATSEAGALKSAELWHAVLTNINRRLCVEIKINIKDKTLYWIVDDKTYDASFTYHFSQSLDMFAQESLRKSLISCQTCLKKLGYSMFDEYKDGTGSSSKNIWWRIILNNIIKDILQVELKLWKSLSMKVIACWYLWVTNSSRMIGACWLCKM